MITKVHIHELATYKDVDVPFKKFTMIFGSNGTGKTTLSNAFLDYSNNKEDPNHFTFENDGDNNRT